jgi:hypothetical protein
MCDSYNSFPSHETMLSRVASFGAHAGLTRTFVRAASTHRVNKLYPSAEEAVADIRSGSTLCVCSLTCL